MNLAVQQKPQKDSWLVKQLIVSQEEICSMELAFLNLFMMM
jgi:hypothetical protein